MHPSLVGAAAQIYPGNLIRVLAAWKHTDEAVELAGIWAFCIARARRAALPVTVLNTPAFPNAYVARGGMERDAGSAR